METVTISETSAIQPAPTWCHQPETGFTAAGKTWQFVLLFVNTSLDNYSNTDSSNEGHNVH